MQQLTLFAWYAGIIAQVVAAWRFRRSPLLALWLGADALRSVVLVGADRIGVAPYLNVYIFTAPILFGFVIAASFEPLTRTRNACAAGICAAAVVIQSDVYQMVHYRAIVEAVAVLVLMLMVGYFADYNVRLAVMTVWLLFGLSADIATVAPDPTWAKQAFHQIGQLAALVGLAMLSSRQVLAKPRLTP